MPWLDDWPPTTTVSRWFPATRGHLPRQALAGRAPVSSFRYVLAGPTSSLGGPPLSPAVGPQDNRIREARKDVLTFTAPPLPPS